MPRPQELSPTDGQDNHQAGVERKSSIPSETGPSAHQSTLVRITAWYSTIICATSWSCSHSSWKRRQNWRKTINPPLWGSKRACELVGGTLNEGGLVRWIVARTALTSRITAMTLCGSLAARTCRPSPASKIRPKFTSVAGKLLCSVPSACSATKTDYQRSVWPEQHPCQRAPGVLNLVSQGGGAVFKRALLPGRNNLYQLFALFLNLWYDYLWYDYLTIHVHMYLYSRFI